MNITLLKVLQNLESLPITRRCTGVACENNLVMPCTRVMTAFRIFFYRHTPTVKLGCSHLRRNMESALKNDVSNVVCFLKLQRVMPSGDACGYSLGTGRTHSYHRKGVEDISQLSDHQRAAAKPHCRVSLAADL